MANLLRYRKKWFLWLGAHGLLYAFMLPAIAPLFEASTTSFPVTLALLGFSILGMAGGLVVLKDPAKMHDQNRQRRPKTSVADTANVLGKLSFAFMIVPLSAGLVDAVVTGQNHALAFFAVAAIGAVVYWRRLGAALQVLTHLPKRARRPGTRPK